jgi:predicted MFS family arabinose efflux permease
MQSRLWSLTLGNFAIGTGAMIVPGMLNELTADLATTPAAIGLIISAFAMTVCIGGPLLAAWTSAIERRKLLTAALALYAVTHIAAAFAPGYGTLLAVRIVTAIGAAVFTAQAAATAGLLVPPEARGKAIGLVFLGWSISAVAGVPIGAYLGAHIGWRPTIGLVGVASAIFAAWVWRKIPAGLFVAPMDRAAWKSLFGNTPLLLAISVTGIQAAGMFTVFSYMALVLKDFIGATPTLISVLFFCFGVTGVIGNIIASRVMDRVGAARVALLAMGCMAIALLLWPLTRGSLTVTVALSLLWGLGCFAVNGAQQARLVGLAPQLASASVALNSSGIYLGQAFGALVGGWIIASHGTANLSLVGTVLMAAAMVVSHIALGMATRQRLARAA